MFIFCWWDHVWVFHTWVFHTWLYTRDCYNVIFIITLLNWLYLYLLFACSKKFKAYKELAHATFMFDTHVGTCFMFHTCTCLSHCLCFSHVHVTCYMLLCITCMDICMCYMSGWWFVDRYGRTDTSPTHGNVAQICMHKFINCASIACRHLTLLESICLQPVLHKHDVPCVAGATQVSMAAPAVHKQYNHRNHRKYL